MASSSPTQVSFQILDVLQGPPDQPLYYRIKAGSSVRYLAASKPRSSLPDTPGQDLGFNTVPIGDWNMASLVSSTDGKFALASTEKKSLPNATPLWHVSRIDFLELGPQDYNPDDNLQLRGGHVPSGLFSIPKSLGAAKVVAFWNLDLEGEHNHGLLRESHTYSLIQDTSIAPKFLAHLTECHDRVIGYVLEATPGRPVRLSDLDACREVLQKLHSLGIAHGSLTPDAFLIRHDSPVAQMQFFYSSYETTDRAVLDKEMSSLETVLQQLPTQQPAFNQALSDIVTSFQERDGYVHPVVFWQSKHEGRISISPDDHRAMIASLAEKN
ncbi:hypothetical protein V8E51_019959 [Hyaloscypha variabilis]